MKFGKLAACIAATSLMASPALAQSQQSAAKAVSAQVERVAATSSDSSKLEGDGVLIGLLASVAVIGGFFLIAEVSDSPSSP
tara:strand:- start:133 stop:378 length:246 start_codon:yes stop_codon:yes gene_type:complete